MNLVSRQDVQRFVSRHLLDSLTLAKFVAPSTPTPTPATANVLDIGTGGGLPGLPLAILLPGQSFTLVDRSHKKIRFLQQVARTLGLANVTPLACDVADLAGQQQFAVVVSRAVASPPQLWSLAQPLLVTPSSMANLAQPPLADEPPAPAVPAKFTPRLVLQTQVTTPQAAATVANQPRPPVGDTARDAQALGFSDAVANQIDIQRYETSVPGLQSVHQILVLTQRTPL